MDGNRNADRPTDLVGRLPGLRPGATKRNVLVVLLYALFAYGLIALLVYVV